MADGIAVRGTTFMVVEAHSSRACTRSRNYAREFLEFYLYGSPRLEKIQGKEYRENIDIPGPFLGREASEFLIESSESSSYIYPIS
jgi:hypothetical protein